jgi:CheY-specific phosphatase CheX
MIDNHISTKDDVTYTSGRGLGLSIVKSETERLGGTFGIIAESGKGTSFLFRLPYEATEQTQNLEASSILDPLAETAKEFIADRLSCKILNVNKYSSSKLEHILLKDFTSLIGIKGVFCGKFVITIDRLLAEKLLKNIIIGELNEEDICLYIEDVLAESSNIIIGNSIKKFMGLEDQIVMEPPIAIELPNAVMRFISSSAWSCSLESEYGNIVISLIVPNNSCFGLSC